MIKNKNEKEWIDLTQTEIFYKTIEEDERELRAEKVVNKEKIFQKPNGVSY